MPQPVDEPKTLAELAARGGRPFIASMSLAAISGLMLIYLQWSITFTVILGRVTWEAVVLWTAAPVVMLWCVVRYRKQRLKALANASPVLDGLDQVEDATYVLYLRPFSTDARLLDTEPSLGTNTLASFGSIVGAGNTLQSDMTWEERLVRTLRRFGKVIAVGRPVESLRPPGAARFYLPQNDWKATVSDAIQRARLVVIVIGDSSAEATADGTLWEYTEAVRLLPPSRLLLLVTGGPDTYDQFRDAAAKYFKTRSGQAGKRKSFPAAPKLPNYPDAHRPPRRKPSLPLHGIIRFTGKTTARFTRFDPAAQRGWNRWGRKRVGAKLDPLLDQIEESLPGKAVRPTFIRWYNLVFMLTMITLAWLVATTWVNTGELLVVDTLTLGFGAASPVLVYVTIANLLLVLAIPASYWVFNQRLLNLDRTRVLVRADEASGQDPGPRYSPSALKASPFRLPPGLIEALPMSQFVRAATQLFPFAVLIPLLVRDRLPFDFGWILFPVTGLLVVSVMWWNRQTFLFYTTRRIPHDLEYEPSTLYVRPFGGRGEKLPNGHAFVGEHVLSRLFAANNGRFTVAGAEAEIAPLTFLPRMPLTRPGWQQQLTEAMPLAKIVVLPAVNTAETIWQFTEAVRIMSPLKLVLVLPAGAKANEAYRLFRDEVTRVLRDRASDIAKAHRPGFRAPVLPVTVDECDDERLRELPLRGVMTFDRDWNPRVRSFDVPVFSAEFRGRDALAGIAEFMPTAVPERI